MNRWIVRGLALGVLLTSQGILLAESGSSSSSTATAPTPAQQATNLVDRLTTLLDLTSTQQTSAISIFTTEFTALAAIQTNLATQQSNLVTAIEANNSTNFTAAANQIGSLTGQQVLAEATAQAAFYLELSSTQQTKYAALKLGNFDGLGSTGPGPVFGGGPGPGQHH